MHTPPTVEYPVGRSPFQTGALIALGLALASVNAWWFFQVDRVDWRQWLGLALSAGAATVAVLAWRVPAQGTLRWDGDCWWWESHGNRVSGGVVPGLDLQRVLLLRFTALSGQRRWLWLGRAKAEPRWSALRRAVVARTRIAGDDAAPKVSP